MGDGEKGDRFVVPPRPRRQWRRKDHEAARGWTGGHGDTFIEGQKYEGRAEVQRLGERGLQCTLRDDERGLGGAGGVERVGQDAAELRPLSVSFGRKGVVGTFTRRGCPRWPRCHW